jgi:hypothetical protein
MLCMDRVKLMSGMCRLPSSRASDLRGVLVVGQPTRRSPRVSVRQSFSSAFSAPVNDVHVEVHACLSRKKKEVHACLSRKKKKFMHAYLQKGTAFRWMVNLTAAKTDV